MKRIWDDRYTVRDWIELAIYGIGIMAVLVGGVRIAIVTGQSMEPTLPEYSVHVTIPDLEPEVGDIVTFWHDNMLLVKRVVAGPGDIVNHWGKPITLGVNEYYVLGDNRENSRDSRSFGPIDGADITGRLIF